MKYISVASNDLYETWQVLVMLESFREFNVKLEYVEILIFTPYDRKGQDLSMWEDIMKWFPEVKFYHYTDTTGECWGGMSIYRNIFRFWVCREHWKQYPELAKQPVFFHDTDIILHKELDFSTYLEDDITYWSDCTSYVSCSYFDSKVKDVLPNKLEKYQKRDIWQEILSIVDKDLKREDISEYDFSTGGCQILYKNIDLNFWERVYEKTIEIKGFLDAMNRQFFLNGDKGFQSFCSDMYTPAILLWSRKQKTKVADWLNFTWSTDHKDKMETTSILHNAAISPDTKLNGGKTFFKGRYANNQTTPFSKEETDYLESIHKDENTKEYGNWFYVDYLIKVKNKYYGTAS